jgi:hypothetical protein
MNRTIPALVGIAAVGALLTGCTGKPSSVSSDQNATNSQLDRYQKNQPIPGSDWSQYRQTLIDVELAQIHGVTTTSFFFNLGTDNPIKMCPSIGYPVPTTSQLTNPDQVVSAPNSQAASIGQAEPNGAYNGSSSGTYVVCVAPNGTKYISYWEGDVQTEGGAAHWDRTAGSIVLDSATVTTKGR